MSGISQNRARQSLGTTNQEKGPAMGPARDDEAPVTARAMTQSWEYIWRSGVAGGLAGCAVSTCPFILQEALSLVLSLV